MSLGQYIRAMTITLRVISFLRQRLAAIVILVTCICAPVNADYFIHLSDVHLQLDNFRAKSFKDADSQLWKSTQKQIKNIIQSSTPPGFILYTGDLPGHTAKTGLPLQATRTATHNKNIKQMLNDLRNLVAATKIPLLYLPGNNDSITGDYFAFADANSDTPLSLSPDTKNPFPAINASGACSNSAAFEPCLVQDVHPKQGYYTAMPVAGLRVIALNTVIWNSDYYTTDNNQSQADAGNAQMEWLSKQLDKAGNDAVYLSMHIPPGFDAYSHGPTWKPRFSNQFTSLVGLHAEKIRGVFFGHTHLDGIRRIWGTDASGNPMVQEVAYSAPGIAHDHGNNPGFKLVHYDAQFEVVDLETHYTWDTSGSGKWHSYSFSQFFGACSTFKTTLACLASMKLPAVCEGLKSIYTVRKHRSYPEVGVEVRPSSDKRPLRTDFCKKF